MNLKNARERIFKTLDYHDEQYEALEIFTLDSIVKKFEEKQASLLNSAINVSNVSGVWGGIK